MSVQVDNERIFMGRKEQCEWCEAPAVWSIRVSNEYVRFGCDDHLKKTHQTVYLDGHEVATTQFNAGGFEVKCSGKISKRQIDEMKKRGHCGDCGNPWWWDFPKSWVCTTCAKTIGKATSEEREPRKGEDDK